MSAAGMPWGTPPAAVAWGGLMPSDPAAAAAAAAAAAGGSTPAMGMVLPYPAMLPWPHLKGCWPPSACPSHDPSSLAQHHHVGMSRQRRQQRRSEEQAKAKVAVTATTTPPPSEPLDPATPPRTPPQPLRRGGPTGADACDYNCMTPEMVTPEKHQATPGTDRGSSDSPLGDCEDENASSLGHQDSWTSWRLEASDVCDVITSVDARRLVEERSLMGALVQPETSEERRVRLQRTFATMVPGGAAASRALVVLLEMLVDAKGVPVPLSDAKRSLRWKALWSRELGSMYTFLRRSCRAFLAYEHSCVSLREPMNHDDVASLIA